MIKKMDAIKKDYIPFLNTPYHVAAFSYIYICIYVCICMYLFHPKKGPKSFL